MNRIVLLLSGGGRLANAADAAADAARQEGAEVVVLYVIDQEVPASVSSWLIYVGFMGDVPSDDYRHTILKEYCRRAQEDLDEAAARLTAAGVSNRTRMEDGTLLETVQRVLAEEQADQLILAIPGKNEVGSALYRGAVRKLQKAGIAVKAVK